MPLVFATPPIALSTAHLLAAFFTFSYVGSLYLSKNARLSFKKGVSSTVDGEERAKENDERWRNDPDVIRARLLAASASTLLSVYVVYQLVQRITPEYESSVNPWTAVESSLARLGITLDFASNPLCIILPCLVAPILYLGPLYADYLSETLPFQRHWNFRSSLLPIVSTWVGRRNYIVGPITEEIVFRACMLSVYHMAGASRKKMIFLSPLWFGIAHLHHAWDTYNRYGRTSSALRIAVMQTLFQLAYTSLFGFHCAFLFLRTGSLLPPTFSHIFCNVMGFPQYGLHVKMFPKRRLAIQLAYLLGIAGYVYSMRWWTKADDSLFWPAPGQPARF
ncbi:Abi-domain-containing protein [Lentinus tigrinus ALCF2SS1-7]|uniref:intramembrane prenyl-peptidase Rce1 n=1 Tax=Lentinus tigrinus ALCF2SS1-6 TaxID=1328759 RepID=A0A5C2SAH4_9APHY|nr:Abi-domain-containing protein [Lentinus tigrinus ALCF2SS1-6]RPD69550.1 Abi-domain-containing protein [Lentinus tigrinus ALCF2SS1-7]